MSSKIRHIWDVTLEQANFSRLRQRRILKRVNAHHRRKRLGYFLVKSKFSRLINDICVHFDTLKIKNYPIPILRRENQKPLIWL